MVVGPTRLCLSVRLSLHNKAPRGSFLHQCSCPLAPPPGPGALVYFEKLTQHQLRALLAPVPPRGCLPGLLCADTDGGLPIVLGYRAAPPARGWPAPWATRSAFIIPDDKAYCPEEFKAPSNWLPHGQESCHCLFPRITSSPLALPAPPFLSLSPPHHPSSP